MIFLLINTVTGKTIYLLDQKQYVVGRENYCDILLENDKSISREHAILRVRDDHVTLEDCKSKYHTLYNNARLKPNVETTLKQMDLIQFGLFKNKYRFESYRFIVAASALSVDKKSNLKAHLDKCGGKFVGKWSDKCTHLTVEKLILTMKVLQALVDGKPMVSPDYWSDYAESVEQKASPPDISKYSIPPIAEHLLKSDFEYKAERKTLFENKVFVFLKTSTKKQMEDIIKSCGGSSISWEDEPKTLLDIKKSPLEYLLIKKGNDEENVSFDAIVKEFNKNKKRTIPINEIALAIICCSCDVNCNPSFNIVSEVFRAATPQQKPKKILALDIHTQEFLPSTSEGKTEKVIPPSVQDDWLESTGAQSKPETSGTKRPAKEIDDKEAKKIKQDDHKQAKMDTFIDPQKTKTVIAQSGSFKSKPQPSQKREAVEEPEKDYKFNPFSSIMFSSSKKSKIKQAENPFELIRTSKSEKTLSSNNEENPFKRIKRLTSSTKSTVSVENFKPKEEPHREFPLIPSTSKVSDISDKKYSFKVKWMSKPIIAKHKPIKEEDPDSAKIAEAFKGCVKVEALPVYEVIPPSVQDDWLESTGAQSKPETSGTKRPAKEIDDREAKKIKQDDHKQAKMDTFIDPQKTKTVIAESGSFKAHREFPLIPSTSKVSDISDKKCSFKVTWLSKPIAQHKPIKGEETSARRKTIKVGSKTSSARPKTIKVGSKRFVLL